MNTTIEAMLIAWITGISVYWISAPLALLNTIVMLYYHHYTAGGDFNGYLTLFVLLFFASNTAGFVRQLAVAKLKRG